MSEVPCVHCDLSGRLNSPLHPPLRASSPGCCGAVVGRETRCLEPWQPHCVREVSCHPCAEGGRGGLGGAWALGGISEPLLHPGTTHLWEEL